MKTETEKTMQKSIESFYAKYKNLLYKKAIEMVKDQNNVDDLVQEAMCRVLRKKEVFLSLAEEQQVSYFIRTIRNTAINHNRHWTRIRFLSEEDVGERSDPTDDMEERLFRQLDLEAFREGLKQLDANSRVLLTKKYFLFEPDEAIARDLHVKPGSVRVMISRARRKLQKILLENGFDPR